MSVPSSNQQDAARERTFDERLASAQTIHRRCQQDGACDAGILHKALIAAEAERDALRAQLQAVRDLHQPGPVLEGEFIRRDGTRTNRLQDTRCQTCKIESPCLTFTAASAPGVGAAQTRTEDE